MIHTKNSHTFLSYNQMKIKGHINLTSDDILNNKI